MDQFQVYIATYGYAAIFFLLLFGISGIPSPEESFMLFVGFTVSQGTLDMTVSLSIAFFGVFFGMLIAYAVGYYLGEPFLKRFGKYMGLTPERWSKASEHFEKHALWAIIVGYFVPGIRQINPYMAGVSRYNFLLYIIVAAIGAGVWSTTYILIGYFLGNKIQHILEVSPFYILLVGLGFLLIFIVVSVVQIYRIKSQED